MGLYYLVLCLWVKGSGIWSRIKTGNPQQDEPIAYVTFSKTRDDSAGNAFDPFKQRNC